MDEAYRRLDVIETEIWRGNGRNAPSMMERIAVMEKYIERSSRNSTWIVRLVAGTFLAAVGSLIVNFMVHR